MSRFSFDSDIMTCIKLKTAKYHLIYSNFLFSEVITKTLLHEADLQITSVGKERPNRYGHSHNINQPSPTPPACHPHSVLSPGGFFHHMRFWQQGARAEGTLSSLSKTWGHLKISPSQQPGFGCTLIHTGQCPVLGVRLLSALRPALGLGPGPACQHHQQIPPAPLLNLCLAG